MGGRRLTSLILHLSTERRWATVWNIPLLVCLSAAWTYQQTFRRLPDWWMCAGDPGGALPLDTEAGWVAASQPPLYQQAGCVIPAVARHSASDTFHKAFTLQCCGLLGCGHSTLPTGVRSRDEQCSPCANWVHSPTSMYLESSGVPMVLHRMRTYWGRNGTVASQGSLHLK